MSAAPKGWRETVDALDALSVDDPETAHVAADDILLAALPPQVGDAYFRVATRARWWAYA